MERGSTSKRNLNYDYISSMPDPILQHILSLLETREAVQTSILSKRWTTLWTSLPSLYFNFIYEPLPDLWDHPRIWDQETWERYWSQLVTKEIDQAVFARFVSMVLHRRESCDVHRFHLNCKDAEMKLTHDYAEWIQYALRHNVRELRFSTRPYSTTSRDSLPSCIFDCSSLEELHLEIHPMHGLFKNKFPPVYDFYCSDGREAINLPNLKEMHLTGIILDASLSVRIFLGCPSLEHLWLEDCPFRNFHVSSNKLKSMRIIFNAGRRYEFMMKEDFVARIIAPNLTYFYFNGQPEIFRNITFENTSSLIHLHIEFGQCSYIDQDLDEYSSESSDKEEDQPWESFFAISSVKDLVLRGRSFKNFMEEHIPKLSVFSNLESFSTGGFCLSCNFYLLAKFLEHSPNIKKLTLEHDGRNCETFDLHNGRGSSARLSSTEEGSRNDFESSSNSSNSADRAPHSSSWDLSSLNCKNLNEIEVEYFSNDGSVQQLLDSLFHGTMQLSGPFSLFHGTQWKFHEKK